MTTKIIDHGENCEETSMSRDRLNRIPEYFSSRYVETGKIPCIASLVSRHGRIVHESYAGQTAFEGGKPIDEETIFRIYSMTKPVTSVALMMLYEEGLFRLDEPISRYIPEFAKTKVWDGGTRTEFKTRDPDRPIQIRDLLTHTSGITYGFLMQHHVDALYRKEKIGSPKETLGEMCKRIAELPLVFSPGTGWNYGHSTDVVGHLVEILSGMELDEFFQERIFSPLGMADTGFFVPTDKIGRLMTCYDKHPITKEVTISDPGGSDSKAYASRPKLLNGGGGLVSTLRDYHTFCRSLLVSDYNEVPRLLADGTLSFMCLNHLPKRQTIKEMGDQTFSEARMDGNGFGLGWAVIVDEVENFQPCNAGTFSWGGLASTYFWIDPFDDLIAINATQMIPSNYYPLRPQFQQLVYAAVDFDDEIHSVSSR